MTSQLATQHSTNVVRTANVVPDRAVGQESQNGSEVQNNRTNNLNQAERNQTVSEQVSNAVQNNAQNISQADVSEVAERLNEFVKGIGRDLSFSVDEDLEKIVITVTDTQTDEVIRTIPSEEALVIAKRIEESMSLLFSEEA